MSRDIGKIPMRNNNHIEKLDLRALAAARRLVDAEMSGAEPMIDARAVAEDLEKVRVTVNEIIDAFHERTKDIEEIETKINQIVTVLNKGFHPISEGLKKLDGGKQ